jgi:hypothetical protein
LTDVEDLTNIRICIATVVDQEVGGKMLAATPTPAAPEANKMEVPALTEKEKVCYTLEDSTLQPVCVSVPPALHTHGHTRRQASDRGGVRCDGCAECSCEHSYCMSSWVIT